MQLEVQGRVLPFWKPQINISKDPDCHGCCSTLNVCQAMLKNCIPLSRLMQTTVFLTAASKIKYCHCLSTSAKLSGACKVRKGHNLFVQTLACHFASPKGEFIIFLHFLLD